MSATVTMRRGGGARRRRVRSRTGTRTATDHQLSAQRMRIAHQTLARAPSSAVQRARTASSVPPRLFTKFLLWDADVGHCSLRDAAKHQAAAKSPRAGGGALSFRGERPEGAMTPRWLRKALLALVAAASGFAEARRRSISFAWHVTRLVAADATSSVHRPSRVSLLRLFVLASSYRLESGRSRGSGRRPPPPPPTSNTFLTSLACPAPRTARPKPRHPPSCLPHPPTHPRPAPAPYPRHPTPRR